MNINSLTSLLYELTNRNISKVSPTAKTENAESTRNAMVLDKKVLEALDTTQHTRYTAKAENQRPAEPTVSQPVFTPLPFRSEIFPEAKFFARLDERNAASATSKGSDDIEVIVYLDTENMGHIWINLSLLNNSLSVKYYTENEGSSKLLRENFLPIKNDLKKIGFQEVSLISQTSADLSGLTNELIPKFEAFLVNLKI